MPSVPGKAVGKAGKPSTKELLANLRTRAAAGPSHGAPTAAVADSTVAAREPAAPVLTNLPRIHASNYAAATAAIRSNTPFLLVGPVINDWGLLCRCTPIAPRHGQGGPGGQNLSCGTTGSGGASASARNGGGDSCNVDALEAVSLALLARFGAELEVPVVDCSAASAYDAESTVGGPSGAGGTTEPLGAFLGALRQHSMSEASASTIGSGTVDPGAQLGSRYLKDFHFAKVADAMATEAVAAKVAAAQQQGELLSDNGEFAGIERAGSSSADGSGGDGSGSAALYNVPFAFRDDWLNGWHAEGGAEDDYRFMCVPRTRALFHWSM